VISFSITQKRRLTELGASSELLEKSFKNVEERDEFFDNCVSELVSSNKNKLKNLVHKGFCPSLRSIERKIQEASILQGFTEVSTPILMPSSYIRRMGIDESNKLWKQVIWITNNLCLRPMLAPNLYYVMRRLRRFLRPVRIFEIGPCFRKEEEGLLHSTEFTMANIVELAPDREPLVALRDMIDKIMTSIELINYDIKESPCAVYGKTFDVLVNDIEVASGVVGPIPIDINWGITEPWAGVGFGLERLAMLKKGLNRIKPVVRSLTYLDGILLIM
jgi:phenylalanyl-tRNA synthetase alpha chain